MPRRVKSGPRPIALRISQKPSRKQRDVCAVENPCGDSRPRLSVERSSTAMAPASPSELKWVQREQPYSPYCSDRSHPCRPVSVSSCHRSKTPAAKRYPFTGRVVSVDTQAQSAIIDGDAIPGFMEAMAMPYKVKPDATLNHLHAGDSISAEVVVVQPDPKNEDAAPDYWLENVRTITHIDSVPAAGANSLHMPCARRRGPGFFLHQSGRQANFSPAIPRERSVPHLHLYALSVSRLLPAHEQQLRGNLQADRHESSASRRSPV